jgi:tetratricopeptide (TPR) repeat protein
VLDKSSGEAHYALAAVRMWYDRNWRETESQLKRAIELKPEFAESYTLYARLLGAMGRFDEAIAAAKRSSEVDPHSPHVRRLYFGGLYFFARRYDLAIEEFRKYIDEDPGGELPHLALAEVYVQQQKFTEALVEARKAKPLLRNPGQLARLGAIFAAAEDTKKATEILGEVKDVSSKRVKYFIASIYAALGYRTEAIDWLTKAVDEFDTNVIDLKVDPRFDSLRQDARFTALLGRMKLVQ